MTGRETLNMPDLDDDLEDFAPRGRAGQGGTSPVHAPLSQDVRRSVDAVSQFPSRDPLQVEQLNLKGPGHVLNRFRVMCKEDRRSYYDMLEILMDSFEGKQSM